jgi:hypothetical protein
MKDFRQWIETEDNLFEVQYDFNQLLILMEAIALLNRSFSGLLKEEFEDDNETTHWAHIMRWNAMLDRDMELPQAAIDAGYDEEQVRAEAPEAENKFAAIVWPRINELAQKKFHYMGSEVDDIASEVYLAVRSALLGQGVGDNSGQTTKFKPLKGPFESFLRTILKGTGSRVKEKARRQLLPTSFVIDPNTKTDAILDPSTPLGEKFAKWFKEHPDYLGDPKRLNAALKQFKWKHMGGSELGSIPMTGDPAKLASMQSHGGRRGRAGDPLNVGDPIRGGVNNPSSMSANYEVEEIIFDGLKDMLRQAVADGDQEKRNSVLLALKAYGFEPQPYDPKTGEIQPEPIGPDGRPWPTKFFPSASEKNPDYLAGPGLPKPKEGGKVDTGRKGKTGKAVQVSLTPNTDLRPGSTPGSADLVRKNLVMAAQELGIDKKQPELIDMLKGVQDELRRRVMQHGINFPAPRKIAPGTGGLGKDVNPDVGIGDQIKAAQANPDDPSGAHDSLFWKTLMKK